MVRRDSLQDFVDIARDPRLKWHTSSLQKLGQWSRDRAADEKVEAQFGETGGPQRELPLWESHLRAGPASRSPRIDNDEPLSGVEDG